MFKKNNLAVYGTLRTGLGQKGFIKGYKLVRVKNAHFPAILKGDGKVIVEVMRVSDDELKSIDRYEDVHNGLYKRVIVPVTLFKNKRTFNAYIYEGGNIQEYEELSGGDWEVEKKKHSK
tara:strand:+ start:3754 stop:4110 length:357 start_codon:yes stop_codon:yes gene_type:complete